jgi:hypothetical protein
VAMSAVPPIAAIAASASRYLVMGSGAW